MPPTVDEPHCLSDAEQREVREVAESVERRDGAPPLSDQALVHLGSASVRHLLVRDGERLVGYGQQDGRALEVATAAADAVDVVLVVAESAAPDGLLVWSHGRGSVLVPVLDVRGYIRERTLHQLRRDLTDPVPPAELPDGVRVRPFVVGVDEGAWLRVNAAAFASHAEQGRWTRADLEAREAEPWFDADGFLLAVRGDELLGFHWTKVHPDGAGEVYVIGVDPSAQGMRLGPALLTHGLEYLAGRGCAQVLLYVDESNTAAMRLYERYGFHRHDVDVQWRKR